MQETWGTVKAVGEEVDRRRNYQAGRAMTIVEQAIQAKVASRQLAALPASVKNKAILEMATRLEAATPFLLAENKKDLETGRTQGLAVPLIARLTLTATRISEVAAGLRDVAALPDPVGEITHLSRRPNGMQVGQMRVPIGVIGIIYESRPNVTADVSALCIKSGNSVILRGGSEAIHSNIAIAKTLREAGMACGLPPGAITLIETTDRQAILDLLKLDTYIDLVIPRGGEGLIHTVVENAKMPVMRHDKGVCHVYVDASADLQMAEEICLNAKVQSPATCNAMETLLVHQDIAPVFLPTIFNRLQAAKVEIRGCPATLTLLGAGVLPATETDWGTEYLDLILSIKIVPDLDAAVEHIATYGSQHSDAIITQTYAHANRFVSQVDSSAVFVNASTRLNDGYQFGLGAEMGISTSRIHARGPMGLEALTCMKFVVFGNGQIRA